MGQAEAIADLKGRVGVLQRHAAASAADVLSLGAAAIDERLDGRGLAYGTHEAAGVAGEATSAVLFALLLLARLFAVDRTRPALVVQEARALHEGGELYGPGLHALGLDPGRVALTTARDGVQALRTVDEAVRSRAVCAVVAELVQGARRLDLATTQRWNVHGQQTGVRVLLLTPDLSATSAALTRWRTRPAPSVAQRRFVGPPTLELELVRNRLGRLGRWTVEWSCEDEAFRLAPRLDDAALRAPVVSTPGDRPGAAPPAPRPAAALGAGGQGQGRAQAGGGR
jgi:protein ImuA